MFIIYGNVFDTTLKRMSIHLLGTKLGFPNKKVTVAGTLIN
jgi:hypothetical protein